MQMYLYFSVTLISLVRCLLVIYTVYVRFTYIFLEIFQLALIQKYLLITNTIMNKKKKRNKIYLQIK